MTTPRTTATQQPESMPLGILAPLTNPGFRLPPLVRPAEVAGSKFRRPWPAGASER